MGKWLCRSWGWMSAKALLCLSLQTHEVPPKAGCCVVTSRSHASPALPQCRMLLGMRSESRTVFLLQDARGHSHQQSSSELTKCFTSGICHSSESLQQTITRFLCFISALSLFPRGSQVSIGNLAMGSWFFQRSNTRAPQAGRRLSGPGGKKQMDRKPSCFPKLFKSKCSFAMAL